MSAAGAPVENAVAGAAPPRLRRSFGAQMLREVAGKLGARIGLAWIALLVLAAVFAPFFAISRPLLLIEGGHVSSPLLAAVTAGDGTLLIVFFSAVALTFARIALRYQVLALLVITTVAGLIANLTVATSELTIYERYREGEAAGQYAWLVRAPIPYSPKDYLRDKGDAGLQAPLADPARPHLMGTDENGADVVSRIARGIGFVATGIALVIGVFIGGLMGYFSGIVDMVGMRLVETFEAVPTLFLLLTFVAFFGANLYMMMVIIGLTGWTGYTRFVRA